MKDGQTEVYVLCCPTRALCEASPYVESYQRAGVEVLYTFTPFDELVHSRMPDVGGRAIKLIDHATLPESLAPKREENSSSLGDEAVKELCAFLKTALGSRVLDVEATSRLFDSPCAVSGHENAGTRQMRKMFMARAGAPAMATPPVTMLINPHHPTIIALSRSDSACMCGCGRCDDAVSNDISLLRSLHSRMSHLYFPPPAAFTRQRLMTRQQSPSSCYPMLPCPSAT
jgi:molecular chaperone HtpG/TNF receptor-associated protein 1